MYRKWEIGRGEAEASEGQGGELGDIIPGYLILDSASAFRTNPGKYSTLGPNTVLVSL